MHPSSHRGIDDMTNLTDLHEGSILRNLKLRFAQDQIYVSPSSSSLILLTWNGFFEFFMLWFFFVDLYGLNFGGSESV